MQESIDFMRNIYLKSGLGDETYGPPFIFEEDKMPTLNSANQEAQEGIFSSIDDLLAKTLIDPQSIDIVIVTCGSFSPSPSLSSLILNHYKLRSDVKTYNLSGMGCSSGVISIDFAARVLRGGQKVQNALVVITESITLNWYNGDNRSMLVTNCIFRVGCAAAIISNNPNLFQDAKMELVHSLRTHHGADDSAYKAAFQEEDDKGIVIHISFECSTFLFVFSSSLRYPYLCSYLSRSSCTVRTPLKENMLLPKKVHSHSSNTRFLDKDIEILYPS